MSKSIAKAFTENKTDELFTPKILVECLKPYFETWMESHKHTGQYYIQGNIPKEVIKEKFTVWCPFDLESSEFVFFFKQYKNIEVIYSHISEGKDFFTYEPKHWDIAISNPPFSRKLDVFKRLNSFRKPWAMIVNAMSINYQEVNNYFVNNPIQMLIPDKRISFDGNPSSFNSCYICKDFLPKDLIFCHLDNNNAKQYYNPSRMYKDFILEENKQVNLL